MTVTARIEDRGRSVGRIEWAVDGITAAVSTRPVGGNGPVFLSTQELALDPGDNIIEVVAYNGSNLLASLPARQPFPTLPPRTRPNRSPTSLPSASINTSTKVGRRPEPARRCYSSH